MMKSVTMCRFAAIFSLVLALAAPWTQGGATEPQRSVLFGGATPPGSPRVGDLVFGAQGNVGFPTYSNTVGFQVVSGYENLETETWLPAQPVGWRVAISEGWGITNGLVPIENGPVPQTTSTIAWGSLFTSFAGTSFIGDIPYTKYGLAVQPGSFTISDALPAVSDASVARHVLTTPLGGARAAGYNFTKIAEAQRRSATTSTFDAIRSTGSGTSVGSAIFNNEAWQLSALLAPRTAGQHAHLMLGTSIMRGQDATYRYLLSPGYASGLQQGAFTSVISANGVMTVSAYVATNGGAIDVGSYIPEADVYVIGKGTGTGGNGTYTVSKPIAVGSASMTAKIGRNAYGYLPAGLDNIANGRQGWWQMAINGASIAQQDHNIQGSLAQRYAFLKAVAKENGGRWPVTEVTVDLRNDLVQFNGTDANDTLVQWVAATRTALDAVRRLFPGLPIHLVDMPPIQSSASFGPFYYTDTANQVPTVGNFKAAAVLLWNAYIAANKASLGISSVCPAGSAAIAPDDGSGIAKWIITPFNLAGAGTLAVQANTGDSMVTTGISITSTVPPEIGTYIVIEPGLGNAEMVGQSGSSNVNGWITSVVNTAANTWTVKVAASGVTVNLTKTHLVGSVIKTSATQDGTHPSHYLQEGPMAAGVVTWKATIPAINWLLKRDVDPASNDNDPMWLEKAA